MGALDYVAKPFHLDEVRARVSQALDKRRLLIENRSYQKNLEVRVEAQARRIEELFLEGVHALVYALEAKDAYTRGHSMRVANYSVEIARALSLDSDLIDTIALGAELHDVGKIGISESVLHKAGKLSDAEYRHIMEHTVIGARILGPLMRDAPGALAIVRSHHERLDGTGSPDSLKGDQIPFEARLVSVADAFDALMVSVSGVRGLVGTDLTPEVVARWAGAFGTWAKDGRPSGRRAVRPSVVIGRDARTSGPMFTSAAIAGLQSVGCQVIDVGLVATPTVQLAVEHHRAAGGIILTASHNPIEWNALKFVGPDGIFLDSVAGTRVRELAAGGENSLPRASYNAIGGVEADPDAISRHLAAVLALRGVDVRGIRRRRFRVALDCVRGAGGAVMPELLERLGCRVAAINTETDGLFPRPPEPVPENLKALGALVRRKKADIGIAVDPDVDRLAIVDERGHPIGEDYTLAFAIRTVLGTG